MCKNYTWLIYFTYLIAQKSFQEMGNLKSKWKAVDHCYPHI